MRIPNIIRPPNEHRVHRSAGTRDAACPYSGQPVSRKEYKEIQALIQAEVGGNDPELPL